MNHSAMEIYIESLKVLETFRGFCFTDEGICGMIEKMEKGADYMTEIVLATEKDIPELMAMIHEIYDAIPIKEWFCLNSDEAVTGYMTTGGFALKAMCDGKLAGVFIVRTKELGEENIGYDLNFNEEQRKQSAHMEIAMVRKEYRGQGLQRFMMEKAEQMLIEQGFQYLLGTAPPDN